MVESEDRRGRQKRFSDTFWGNGSRSFDLALISEHQSRHHFVEVARSAELGYVLIMDGSLQLASLDEGFYHELLVHPGLTIVANRVGRVGIDVLILGGGDGCALREVLKWKVVRSVTVVEHDRLIVDLFSRGVLSSAFSTADAFGDARTSVIECDAFAFVSRYNGKPWDFIVVDLTDGWIGPDRDLVGRAALALCKMLSTTGMVAAQLGPDPVEGRRRVQIVERARSILGLRMAMSWSLPLMSFGESWLLGLFSASLADSDVEMVVPSSIAAVSRFIGAERVFRIE